MGAADSAAFLWGLIGAALNCERTRDGVKTKLVSLDCSHIFIRTVASATSERQPEFLSGVLSARRGLKLDKPDLNHYLVLIYPAGDRPVAVWQRLVLRQKSLREQLSAALEKADLHEYLLPELESPIPNDVKDWLEFQLPAPEEKRDAIAREIEIAVKAKLKIADNDFAWLDQDLFKEINSTAARIMELKEKEFRKRFGIPQKDLKDIIIKILEKPEFTPW